MKRCLSAIALVIVFCTSASAQSSRHGWWGRIGAGAGQGTILCNGEAFTWICGSSTMGRLFHLDGAVGRSLNPRFDLGLEVSPDRSQLTVNAHNQSTLTSWALRVVTRVFPMDQVPAFLHLGIGISRSRLRELNNDHLFVERGLGWNGTAGVGAEFRVARLLAAGPFLRLDFSEFGEADGFFSHLQQRTVSLGVSLTIQ